MAADPGRCPLRIPFLLLSLSLAQGLSSFALSQPDDEPKKSPASPPAPTMQTLDILPMNEKSTGLILPDFDDAGRPAGRITAASATRVSNETLELESMHIEIKGANGQDIAIDLPRATYNLQTSMLLGTRDVVITRVDFILTGDILEFNTKTRESVLRGNIKMLIHERKTSKDTDDAP